MNAELPRWTYALAPDAAVDATADGGVLRTATTLLRLDDDEAAAAQCLVGPGVSQAAMAAVLQRERPGADARTPCAALLLKLDGQGLLVRTLLSGDVRLASCVPLRAPPGPPPGPPNVGVLRLAGETRLRVADDGLELHADAAWATVRIHDRQLMVLVHDLARGRSTSALSAAAAPHASATIQAWLGLMAWCGLLEPAVSTDWCSHDLLFHSRTRRGYARVPLGQQGGAGQPPRRPSTLASIDTARRIALPMPELARLLATDPPFAQVAARRQSIRAQGAEAITLTQLSEFLFRTLHEREGRRPYPSGGGCYALQAYLAVDRCRGLPRGLYAYDALEHSLVPVRAQPAGLARLLTDAAGTAGTAQPAQVLLVLAANHGVTQAAYGALGYSLVLKEVGAVFQAGMLAASAMGLASCPLGCGDSLLFAALSGVDALAETSVGEFMLGSLDHKP